MKLVKILSVIFALITFRAFSQCTNCLFQMNGSVVVSMSGTSTASSYIILNATTPASDNLFRTTTGRIVNVNNNGFNFVSWNVGTTQTTFSVPFGNAAGTLDLPMTVVTGAGGNANSVLYLGSYGTNNLNANPPVYVADQTDTSSWWGHANNDVIDRYYNIWVDGTTQPASTVTFRYDGTTENTLAASNTDFIGAQKWDAAAVQPGWQLPIGSVAASTLNTASFTFSVGADNFIKRSNNKSGAWILSRVSKPLPIELGDFEARCAKGKVFVKWVTITETNNDYFTLEKSTDGNEFVAIATISGAGNSSIFKNYGYLDNNPTQGTIYYRLKQTDFDGKTKTLKTVSTNCEDDNAGNPTGISSYPNPAVNNQDITIELSGLDANENVPINLFNSIGQVVFSGIATSDADGNAFYQVAPNAVLSAGVYTITAMAKAKTLNNRLIINR